MPGEGSPDVLTVPELARLLRVGRNQAYALVASGEIYAARIGRSIRIPRTAVDRYLGGQPPISRQPGLRVAR